MVGLNILVNTNTKVYNNIFYNLSTDAISAIAETVDIKNNIILNSATALSVSGGTVTADYNLYFNNTTNYSGIAQGSNDITGQDPLFIDIGSSDFRLKPSSPAINAGTDLSGDVTEDILGVDRPQGGRFDIGAYETYDFGVTIHSIAGGSEQYTNVDNVPEIIFGKISSDSKGVSSYTASIDHDKIMSLSVGGIPTDNDTTTSYSEWINEDIDCTECSGVIAENSPGLKTRTPIKTTYSHEDDGDVSNDRINVAFKNLPTPYHKLTEGLHTIQVRATDQEGAFTDSSAHLFIDQTPPGIEGLTIADVAILPPDPQGQTYTIGTMLPPSQEMLMIYTKEAQ